MKHQKQKIVTIGGGSGQFALLSGLKHLEEVEITAVVSMVDSGGSTGRLRDELGILPPGDVLKCVLALSPYQEIARNILLKRFVNDRRLLGHNAGNMLLTMLSQYTGSFPSAVQALAEILDVCGTILPVTVDRATLVAELTDGTRIYGQTAIDIPRGTQREKIRDVFLVPHHSDYISVYPPVIEAVHDSDYIIIGPGDLFTSILTNLIVPGVKEAIQNTGASILYCLNIMTKFGETHNFNGRDFVSKLEECINRPVDGIIYNTGKPEKNLLEKYREQKAEFVEINGNDKWLDNRRLYASDILDISGGIVRHNSKKLASLIREILFENSTHL
ncbi:MAG: uridine diphosphate-N-acetylglucosamine-binding protein YvcK [Desulfobacteraceae bacterium]|nr:MAG: uridine diphosphate-N-acetylglucosamine-binding protein YvcK [Desulfobacteraceae bacterium]